MERSREWRRTVATGATGLLLASPALTACDYGKVPDSNQACAVDLSRTLANPSPVRDADSLVLEFYAEMLGTKIKQTVPLSPESTIVNFTDTAIDPKNVVAKAALYEALPKVADSCKLEIHADGDSYPATIGLRAGRSKERTYFVVPDTHPTPETFKDIGVPNEKKNILTVEQFLAARDKQVSISYVTASETTNQDLEKALCADAVSVSEDGVYLDTIQATVCDIFVNGPQQGQTISKDFEAIKRQRDLLPSN